MTTAYNSADSVLRNIDALLRQKRPLQEIIVVDNASTDDTSSLLEARYPEVTVLRMQENLGAAGALAAGLSYAALQRKYDWIWMFDQDSVPAPDTLDLMLQHTAALDDTGEGVGIVAALPVDNDMEPSSSPWLWKNGFVKPASESLDEPVLFTDLVITSGSMVRREVVETIGLPRSDFFIDFVDYEYCLRARSRGYKIAVITPAKLNHEIGKARKFRFLGRRWFWSDHRPFREYYMSRNLAYSVWWLYPTVPAKRFVLRHLLRHAVGVLLFGSERLACLQKIVQGFRDGRRASLGIRFLPE